MIDRNPNGVNAIVDKVLSGAFGSSFDSIIASIQSLSDSDSVTVPASLVTAYAGSSSSFSVVINKAELLGFAGGLEAIKGLVQYIASYNLTYPIGMWKLDFGDPTLNKDTNQNGIPDVVESAMAQTVGPFVTSSGLLTDRSQTTRNGI